MEQDYSELVKTLKLSLGDMNSELKMDEYYTAKIKQAIFDLMSDDISEDVINSELGKQTIVVYAELLIKDKEIATNPTLLYLRNRLSDITKGDRHSNV